MDRLFLIGYMGSGKSTIGKQLAKDLQMQFVDTDTYIENRFLKSISQLFKEKGESRFREIEHNALLEIAGFDNTVVSTGGGLPCFFDNMQRMNDNGTTVYLKTPEKVLLERLWVNKYNRPLLYNKTKAEIATFISENLPIRESFYLQAHLVFDTGRFPENAPINKLAEEIRKELVVSG
ncbi:MAG: shikimate kinase [Dysgonamonadaceae bacterium]|nr:shikimate kinase [Dysgonamonadaceae bacterium]